MSNHKLSRRQDYIESSGTTVNVAVTVPLNNAASSNQGLASNVQIPYTSLVASAFSNGGGNGQTISGGAFAGRTSGRGTRNEIYGSARYGSGYGTYKTGDGGQMEYTPEFTLNVSGRDFPHGFPPLTFGYYSGGREYFPRNYNDFPALTPSTDPEGFNTVNKLLIAKKDNQTWLIIADGQTADALNKVLQLPVAQGGCGSSPFEPMVCDEFDVLPMPGTVINITNVDTYTGRYHTHDYVNPWPYPDFVLPWNVLQFYRGSSVALASYDYDNAFAHNGNNNTDYWAKSPLNTTGIDMDYLACLNTTIAAVIPIVNPGLVVRQRMSPGQIAGIVVGAVAGFALLIAGILLFLRLRRVNKQPPTLMTKKIALQPRSSTTKGSLWVNNRDDYQHHDVVIPDDASSTSSHGKKQHL